MDVIKGTSGLGSCPDDRGTLVRFPGKGHGRRSLERVIVVKQQGDAANMLLVVFAGSPPGEMAPGPRGCGRSTRFSRCPIEPSGGSHRAHAALFS
ncbi:hypothetical protein AAFF_G00434300 [Aldrovandia affinis]|uniref:Uncharacterized protein n=1 Tax=Aldrovandia affinis TaxID=143900 RepID=A0AAD7S837_9TELE|nr:hypothetical protein AAFF_G00434300 [Aldrovandia affinis]